MNEPTQKDALIRVLISDFDVYRRATRWWQMELEGKKRGGRPVPPIDIAKHLKPFGVLVSFCAEHSVEPRSWLYSLFQRGGWQYPVGVDKLCAVTHLKKYREGKGRMGFFRQRLQAKGVGDVVLDPNKDLIPSVEEKKAAFAAAGDPDQCRAEMFLSTLGYHPKSLTCQRCPEAARCSLELQASMPFPVILLRLGHITVETAKEMAEAKQ